jgi:hypothetical protein
VSNEVLVVCFEDHFTFFIWQDLLAVPEEKVELLKEMGRSLDINRAAAAVIITNCFFQDRFNIPRLQISPTRREWNLDP